MPAFHLSEKNYRRFEPAFAAVCTEFPKAVKINCGNLRPTTSVARCRDAIKSLEENRWVSSFDVDLFLSLRKDLAVRHFDERSIIIAPKDSDKNGILSSLGSVQVRNPSNVTVTGKEFYAFLVLMNSNIIEGPIALTLTEQINDSEITLNQRYPNVETIDEGNGQYILC